MARGRRILLILLASFFLLAFAENVPKSGKTTANRKDSVPKNERRSQPNAAPAKKTVRKGSATSAKDRRLEQAPGGIEGVAPSFDPSPQELKSIEHLTKESRRTPMLRLNDRDYKKYVLATPRSYGVLVFFTVDNPELLGGQDCTICKDIEPWMRLVARSYWINHDRTNASAPADLFFVRADPEDAMSAFKQAELSSVPTVMYMPPVGKRAPSLPKNDVFPLQRRGSPDHLAEWLSQRTHFPFVVYRSRLLKMSWWLLVAAALALLLFYGSQLAFAALTSIRWAVFAICMAVYGWCVSGGMFDIIQQPPWYYIAPHSGSVVWLTPQHGQQFILEGAAAACCHLLGCLGVCLLAFAVPSRKSVFSQYVTFVASALLVSSFYITVRMYFLKNPYYLRLTD